jgi:septal ring factor EnvC (AmiA/AmiB activator)
MNRHLQWFNLFGVLILAALCVAQWRTNRLLNMEIKRMEQSRIELSANLDNQTRTNAGQTSDIGSLSSHLIRLKSDLKETADKLATSEHQTCQLINERDQLKASVTNWVTATAGRDERLKQSAALLSTIAEERNAAVKSFNDLAARHNRLVQNWNTLQSRLEQQAKTNAGIIR